MDEVSRNYPREWEADVVLRDGATMHIRPVRPSDADQFRALHAGQSDTSVYYRFFAPRATLSDTQIQDLIDVDQHSDVSLALFDGAGEGARMRGIGGFNTTGPGVAEVAFYVADTEHGRGLGSVLLDHLAAAAREVGIHVFEAFVLPANRKMINVFKDAGYRLETALEDGVIELRVDLRSTTKAWRVMMQREQHSEARAMEALMAPSAYVLVDDEHATLAPLASRLLDSGADLVPASAEDIAERLALISVPTDMLAERLHDLAARGVQAAIVYSGHHLVDADLAAEILSDARSSGLRVLGPASHGIVTPDGTDLTIEAGVPSGGTIDVFVQSAETAVHLLSGLRRSGARIRSLVAAGHRLDISGNDTMQYWSAHPSTGPAIICLDTMGNARKFARIARHLATSRPVFALITAGIGAARLPGHLVSTSERPQVLRHILAQSGVVATHSLPVLLDLVRVTDSQGPLRGRRIGVVCSSAALATTVATATERHGLTHGPVLELNLTDYRAIAREATALQDDCDAVIVALTALDEQQTRTLNVAHSDLLQVDRRVPWVAVVGGVREDRIATPVGPIPHFTCVDAALDTLGRLANGHERASQLADASLITFPDLNLIEAHSFVQARADARERTLTDQEAATLLAFYGVDLMASIRAKGQDDSVAAADRIGYPVVLKTRRKELRHRTDLGGVALDLPDPDAVRSAVRRFRERGEVEWDVQAMAGNGVACVVQAWEDDLYGPVVSFALAGDAEEILGDISYRIAPLSEGDASRMIEEVAASVRLRGYRGLPPLDVAGLAEVIERVSMLKDELTDLSALRLHPVIVTRSGVAVAGAEVRLQERRRRDDARRALRMPTR
ncbi:MAG: GNAT family N-acetyltransferase [Bowdeniella nasicola]|nr:GNAT family N-acetyltransferase [Bowdeniella nasicola]